MGYNVPKFKEGNEKSILKVHENLIIARTCNVKN